MRFREALNTFWELELMFELQQSWFRIHFQSLFESWLLASRVWILGKVLEGTCLFAKPGVSNVGKSVELVLLPFTMSLITSAHVFIALELLSNIIFKTLLLWGVFFLKACSWNLEFYSYLCHQAVSLNAISVPFSRTSLCSFVDLRMNIVPKHKNQKRGLCQ